MTPRARLQRLLGSRLTRRLALLVSGTALGQAALIAATPIVTRVYSPEAYGLFVGQLAIVSLMAVVTGLRYEAAIPLCRSDEDASAVSWLVLAISAAVSLGSAAILTGLGPRLVGLLGLEGTGALLWWLPPLLMAQGIFLAFDGWALYQGDVRQLALSKVVQGTATAAGQVGLGLSGGGDPSGLFLAYLVGQLLSVLPMLVRLDRPQRRLFARPAPRRMAAMARRHRRFPIYELWARGFANAAEALPVTLVGAGFGAGPAGIYGLAQRIVGIPIRLLGISASQVYIAELAGLSRHDRPALVALFDATVRRLLVIGGIYLGVVVLFGPQLFALAFGQAWEASGDVARLLAPMYMALFINRPIRYTVQFFGRQDWSLLISISSLSIVLAAFYVTRLWGGGLEAALAIMSGGLCLTQIAFFLLARGLVKGRLPPGRELD